MAKCRPNWLSCLSSGFYGLQSWIINKTYSKTLCMLFCPVRVSLKGFSISFKISWTYCETYLKSNLPFLKKGHVSAVTAVALVHSSMDICFPWKWIHLSTLCMKMQRQECIQNYTFRQTYTQYSTFPFICCSYYSIVDFGATLIVQKWSQCKQGSRRPTMSKRLKKPTL